MAITQNDTFVVERCDQKEGWVVKDFKHDTEGFTEPYLFESTDDAWDSVKELLELQEDFKLSDPAYKDEFRIVSTRHANFSTELYDGLHPCDQLMYKHIKVLTSMGTADVCNELMNIAASQDKLLTLLYRDGHTGPYTEQVRRMISITHTFLTKETEQRNPSPQGEMPDGEEANSE